jgi:hypothetical protein
MFTTDKFRLDTRQLRYLEDYARYFTLVGEQPHGLLYGCRIMDENKNTRFLFLDGYAKGSSPAQPNSKQVGMVTIFYIYITSSSYAERGKDADTFAAELGITVDEATKIVAQSDFVLPYTAVASENSARRRVSYTIYADEAKQTELISFVSSRVI